MWTIMTSDIKDPLLTVPDLAKRLRISDQTVRRWVRRKLVPSTRNPDGWPLVRLKDVPTDLLEKTKKLSSARYRPTRSDAEILVEHPDEVTYLRSQNDRLVEIIRLLSSRLGDHPINT
jgi:hypothetical protein